MKENVFFFILINSFINNINLILLNLVSTDSNNNTLFCVRKLHITNYGMIQISEIIIKYNFIKQLLYKFKKM